MKCIQKQVAFFDLDYKTGLLSIDGVRVLGLDSRISGAVTASYQRVSN